MIHNWIGLDRVDEDIALDESKYDIDNSGCAISENLWISNIFTIPYGAAFPITISWDRNLL